MQEFKGKFGYVFEDDEVLALAALLGRVNSDVLEIIGLADFATSVKLQSDVEALLTGVDGRVYRVGDLNIWTRPAAWASRD